MNFFLLCIAHLTKYDVILCSCRMGYKKQLFWLLIGYGVNIYLKIFFHSGGQCYETLAGVNLGAAL